MSSSSPSPPRRNWGPASYAPPFRRACQLEPGELRCLATPKGVIGLFIACPSCGFRLNTVTVAGASSPVTVERGPLGILVLLPGFTCAYPTCQKRFTVEAGEYIESL